MRKTEELISHSHSSMGGRGTRQLSWLGDPVRLDDPAGTHLAAEIMANRIPTQEEYAGLTPVVAILPWFLAGSLSPHGPVLACPS